jgi:hypothetical protein
MTLLLEIQSSTDTNIPNFLKCVEGWENILNFFGKEMNEKVSHAFPPEAKILRHDAFIFHEPWPLKQDGYQSSIILFETIKTRLPKYFGRFPSLVGWDGLIIKRNSGQLTISRIGIIRAIKEYTPTRYFMIQRSITNVTTIQKFGIFKIPPKSPYIISKYYQKNFLMALWIRVDESDAFYNIKLPKKYGKKQNMIFVQTDSSFSNIEAKYERFSISPVQIFKKKLSCTTFESGSKFLLSEILFSVREQIKYADEEMQRLSDTEFDELSKEIKYYTQNFQNITDEFEEDLIETTFIPLEEFNSRLFLHEYYKTFDK